MGIDGIYREIGNGRRVALAKLADDHFRKTTRPFTIAVDAPIWLFQIQASEGGSSPGIRTLYYRLVRLVLYSIRAVFVFDGPDKPPFKRNAPTSSGSSSSTHIAKRLIELFGFVCHDAPGEAEAECALLQSLGMVDAVLSEDVDTLAFGCTLSIRKWTAEGIRGNKAPTHVTAYDSNDIKQGKCKLDREGMILVALMSGGDYLPEGIPGCGTKVACEAARGDFGYYLCRIEDDDEAKFVEWRENLCNELHENTSGYFKTKHPALAAKLPESFPDRKVLRYYTHPAVSSPDQIKTIKSAMSSSGYIDVKGLRDFVDEEFGWRHLSGAKKFLRQISPALLANRLRTQGASNDGSHEMDIQTEREQRLLRGIISCRTHFSVDGIPELKVLYCPALVADLDLDQETIADDEEDAALSSDEEESEPPGQTAILQDGNLTGIPQEDNIPPSSATVQRRKSKLAAWDPQADQATWLLESCIRYGAPQSLVQWESDNKRAVERKAREVAAKEHGGMKQGALEAYLKIGKHNHLTAPQKTVQEESLYSSHGNALPLPQVYKQPARIPISLATSPPNRLSNSKNSKTSKSATKKNKPSIRQQRKMPLQNPGPGTNPWTMAQRRKPQGESAFARLEQQDADIGLEFVAEGNMASSFESKGRSQAGNTPFGGLSTMAAPIDMTLEHAD